MKMAITSSRWMATLPMGRLMVESIRQPCIIMAISTSPLITVATGLSRIVKDFGRVSPCPVMGSTSLLVGIPIAVIFVFIAAINAIGLFQ